MKGEREGRERNVELECTCEGEFASLDEIHDTPLKGGHRVHKNRIIYLVLRRSSAKVTNRCPLRLSFCTQSVHNVKYINTLHVPLISSCR